MASNWSMEDAKKLQQAAEELRETVETAVKEAHAYRDEVATMGVQALTDGADAIVALVEEGLKPTFTSGVDTIENTAKVTIQVLKATGNE